MRKSKRCEYLSREEPCARRTRPRTPRTRRSLPRNNQLVSAPARLPAYRLVPPAYTLPHLPSQRL